MNVKKTLVQFVRRVGQLEDTYRTSNDEYKVEFQKLRVQSPRHQASSTASLECNIKKNRYKDIIPFEHSRIKLKADPTVSGSDYINANYIKLPSMRNAYIATQGPLPSTVQDFWKMVWESDAKVVIMACNFLENGKKKCEKYWPGTGNTAVYGNFSITLVNQDETYADLIIRTLELKRGNDMRTLNHFHFVAWPDHGIPNRLTSLVDAVKLVQEKQPHDDCPIVVHCSAGCGRTGTVCAVHYAWILLKTGKMTDDFNLFQIVLQMRNYRMAMIQNLDQYILAYRAIAELFQSHLTVTEQNNYENVFDESSLCDAGSSLDNKQSDSFGAKPPTYENVQLPLCKKPSKIQAITAEHNLQESGQKSENYSRKPSKLNCPTTGSLHGGVSNSKNSAQSVSVSLVQKNVDAQNSRVQHNTHVGPSRVAKQQKAKKFNTVNNTHVGLSPVAKQQKAEKFNTVNVRSLWADYSTKSSGARNLIDLFETANQPDKKLVKEKVVEKEVDFNGALFQAETTDLPAAQDLNNLLKSLEGVEPSGAKRTSQFPLYLHSEMAQRSLPTIPAVRRGNQDAFETEDVFEHKHNSGSSRSNPYVNVVAQDRLVSNPVYSEMCSPAQQQVHSSNPIATKPVQAAAPDYQRPVAGPRARWLSSDKQDSSVSEYQDDNLYEDVRFADSGDVCTSGAVEDSVLKFRNVDDTVTYSSVDKSRKQGKLSHLKKPTEVECGNDDDDDEPPPVPIKTRAALEAGDKPVGTNAAAKAGQAFKKLGIAIKRTVQPRGQDESDSASDSVSCGTHTPDNVCTSILSQPSYFLNKAVGFSHRVGKPKGPRVAPIGWGRITNTNKNNTDLYKQPTFATN